MNSDAIQLIQQRYKQGWSRKKKNGPAPINRWIACWVSFYCNKNAKIQFTINKKISIGS